MKSVLRILAPGAVLLLLAACGGPPANNPLLQEARSSYDQARNNPDVVANAPVELQEAERILKQGESLLAEKGDPDEINHYAYIARQRVRIAEQQGALKVAEAAVENAERERNEVQLQARTIEVDRAEEAAEESENRADQAAELADALAERVAELEAEQTERGLVLTLGDVLFDVGKADLMPNAHQEVEEVARFLSEYETRNVLIEGFTDNTGGVSSNLDLSQRRADAVRQALSERGISYDRIRTRGYGVDYPIASNSTSAGRQSNRRVEIVISDEAGLIPDRR